MPRPSRASDRVFTVADARFWFFLGFPVTTCEQGSSRYLRCPGSRAALLRAFATAFKPHAPAPPRSGQSRRGRHAPHGGLIRGPRKGDRWHARLCSCEVMHRVQVESRASVESSGRLLASRVSGNGPLELGFVREGGASNWSCQAMPMGDGR